MGGCLQLTPVVGLSVSVPCRYFSNDSLIWYFFVSLFYFGAMKNRKRYEYSLHRAVCGEEQEIFVCVSEKTQCCRIPGPFFLLLLLHLAPAVAVMHHLSPQAQFFLSLAAFCGRLHYSNLPWINSWDFS